MRTKRVFWACVTVLMVVFEACLALIIVTLGGTCVKIR